jgi:hypothetical protein
MQQSAEDDAKDAAPLEEASPIVAAYNKRIAKQEERKAKP